LQQVTCSLAFASLLVLCKPALMVGR